MRTINKHLFTAFLSLALTASPAFSQPAAPAPGAPKPAAAKPKPTWPPEGPTPRTADGHPDFTGNWEPNAIRQNVDLAATQEVPMLPAAAAIHKKHKDDV